MNAERGAAPCSHRAGPSRPSGLRPRDRSVLIQGHGHGSGAPQGTGRALQGLGAAGERPGSCWGSARPREYRKHPAEPPSLRRTGAAPSPRERARQSGIICNEHPGKPPAAPLSAARTGWQRQSTTEPPGTTGEPFQRAGGRGDGGRCSLGGRTGAQRLKPNSEKFGTGSGGGGFCFFSRRGKARERAGSR